MPPSGPLILKIQSRKHLKPVFEVKRVTDAKYICMYFFPWDAAFENTESWENNPNR